MSDSVRLCVTCGRTRRVHEDVLLWAHLAPGEPEHEFDKQPSADARPVDRPAALADHQRMLAEILRNHGVPEREIKSTYPDAAR